MNRDFSINSQENTKNLIFSSISKKKLLAWSIFMTGILYYCYAYLLRVFPSIMENDLLAHFHITAAAFGNLTAFYYYAYAPMQLPVGVTVDRFGARRSLIFACCMSLIGVSIFMLSHQLIVASLGRFLIGFGSAFAYVTVLKLATIWLPKRYFATATGVSTGAGMLAAIFTDTYLTHLVEHDGYKTALYFCLGAGVVIFLLILYLVQDKKTKDNNTQSTKKKPVISFQQLSHYLLMLTKNPQMWLIGLIGALLYMPASVFLDVWGIPYLKAAYHLTPEQAGIGVSMTLFGWILASPLIGTLSDKVASRKYPLIISSFSATFFAVIIFYVPGISITTLYTLLFLLGTSCAAHPLTFTLSKENNHHKISGTSVAFANCLIMLGGVIFQPVVGKLLDLEWSGIMQHGIRIYTASNYTHALSILPIGLLLSGLLSLAIRDTYHRAND